LILRFGRRRRIFCEACLRSGSRASLAACRCGSGFLQIGQRMIFMRTCGTCTLCCKLLPVKELAKPAGVRCTYQRTGKGCAIHNGASYPDACRLWNCNWLIDPLTADLSRPDRSHYVIDMMPDFVTIRSHASGEEIYISVLQIWCDPKHPDAHRDPQLRRYLDEGGHIALVRYNSRDGFAIFPPSRTGGGWFEQSGMSGREHTFSELLDVLEKETTS
jgi:hypothetical protein